MIIRGIRVGDRAEYLAMCREFYSSEAVSHPVPDGNFLRAFDYFLSDGEFSRAYIFEDNEKIIGYGIICTGYSQEAGGNTVLFDELYIRPDYRGRGIGRQFFNYIFNNYPAARYRLEVDPRNPRAEKLYKSLGFERLEYNQLIRENKNEK